MGAKLKALAVVVGLMLVPLGYWPISALLSLYAAGGLLLRGLGRGRPRAAAVPNPPTSQSQYVRMVPASGFKRGVAHPVRRVLGVVFLGLSMVAFSRGGAYSPFLFAGIGATLLVWGTRLVWLGGEFSFHPVAESILLKRSLDPIHWFSIAEVKLATRHAAKALGGIDETLLVALTDGSLSSSSSWRPPHSPLDMRRSRS